MFILPYAVNDTKTPGAIIMVAVSSITLSHSQINKEHDSLHHILKDTESCQIKKRRKKLNTKELEQNKIILFSLC